MSEKIKLNERMNERNEYALIGRMYPGEYEYWGVVGREGKGRLGLIFRPTIRVVLQIYRQKHNGRVVSQ